MPFYPGVELNVPLIRSSLQPILNLFIPSIFVSIFVLTAHETRAESGARAKAFIVSSLALLTYVQLY